MTGIDIRPVAANERAAWEPLWQGYLDFYESTVTPDNNDILWKRLHDPAEPMFILGAYQDGRLIGIAHYIFHRSCWTVGDYCYLQDLFVVAQFGDLFLLALIRFFEVLIFDFESCVLFHLGA